MSASLLDIDGILLLDKPEGLTSNSVLQKVKRIFRAKKAGHTGSLDPIATGMLPICFGQATKFAQFFIDDDKAYQVVATLGTQMDSGDRTGKPIQNMPVPTLNKADVELACQQFVGDIEQIPPMFSAVKVDGKRLYKHARKGRVIERAARQVRIHEIKLQHINQSASQTQLSLTVLCSKGTYIRTLVEDLATALGTCGHVDALHRLFVGQFDIQKMISFDDLASLAEQDFASLEQTLVPLHTALPSWPKIHFNDVNVLAFQQGQIVSVPESIQQGWVQVCDAQGNFVGLGEANGANGIKPKRLMRTQ